MNTVMQYALIGHPLGHSMSPFIHNRLFALQGLGDGKSAYTVKDIEPESLQKELPLLFDSVAGLNVTIPYKQAVIPYLDRLEGRGALYRSVNTIAVTSREKVGYNTDAEGFLCALKAAGVALQGRVLLLGCGGVGRTFACEAALAGCEIINAVRPSGMEKAEELKRYVGQLAPHISYTVTTLENLPLDRLDLLINATPVGMYPKADAMPVSPTVLTRTAAVFDAIYNPRETKLLSAARAQGAAVIDGMPMLVWQAVLAHTLWYGATFQEEDICRLVEDARLEMEKRFQ